MLEKASHLGKNIGRIGNILKSTATDRINDYQKRLSTANSCYELFVKDLLIDEFDQTDAYKTAKNIFNTDHINFVAIDGTEYSQPLFDMVIFYAGAYSSEGEIKFSSNGIDVVYQHRPMHLGTDLSSCIPIYMDKIPEIDQSYSIQDTEAEVNKAVTDEMIADNSNISNILMTFSEFYLAYRLAITGKYNFILMDRSLSNTYSSLLYDTSIWKLKNGTSALIGFCVDGIDTDTNDLVIARNGLANKQLDLLPSRGDYLRYSILNILRSHDEGLNLDSICKAMNISSNKKIVSQVEKYLKTWTDEKVLSDKPSYRINDRYKTTWTRIQNLVDIIGNQIFHSNKDPFLVKTGNTDKWLTTVDLAYLTLLCLYMLLEACWKNRILLVGITKDTSARDFKNHVFPVCFVNGVWSGSQGYSSAIGAIPNSDRMFLQSLSISNCNQLKIPWASIEYDSAFVTIIPDFKKRVGFVSGAVQNKIIPTHMFLKSFIQLQQAKVNPMFRSNVMAIDRIAFPGYDLGQETLVNFKHEYFGEEIVSVILFKDNRIRNEIQNLILSILVSMTAPSIAEAFGHNKPLYIADKVAKWHNEEFRRIVDSTATAILCDKGLRNFVFYMNSFREKRKEFEATRTF